MYINHDMYYKYSMANEALSKLSKEIDSFLLECYKEFFGKEYKKGDTILEDKQKEWEEFVRSKDND